MNKRLLLTALWIALASHSAFSCSCFSGGGCPGLGVKGGPVFLGTVLTVTDLPRSNEFTFLSSRRARIRVDEPFGGLSPDVHEIDVLTGSGGGDCGIGFKPGEVYLIDSSLGKDELLHVGLCSSTRRIDYADVTLRVLRQRRDGQPVPSLTGQIAQIDRDFNGLLGTAAAKPLANALVRVKTDGKVYETRADTKGVYAFYGLPSGKYEFDPELAPNTSLGWYIGSDRSLVPFEVRASCTERDIEVFASGSIQGHVFDSSGKLLPYASVYILPADKEPLPSKGQLYWESQSKEAFFKFVHIPPGEYLLVINPEDARNPDFPYPRTFYPGVPDRASAKIIAIQGGEQVTDMDIHIREQFKPRHLTVRVKWADGRLVKDYVSVLAKGTADPGALSNTSQPNMKVGVVDLSILPNEPYDVEAELICQYADDHSIGPGERLKSNKEYIVAGDRRTEISLTIPATSCREVPGKTLLTERESPNE